MGFVICMLVWVVKSNLHSLKHLCNYSKTDGSNMTASRRKCSMQSLHDFSSFFKSVIDYFYLNIVIYGGFASKVDS